MSQLFEALKKAGLVSPTDEVRVRAESEAQSKVDEELRRRALAMYKLGPGFSSRLTQWERDTGRLVSTGMLVEWSLLDEVGRLREWNRWVEASRAVS